jgi:hypothetical protein
MKYCFIYCFLLVTAPNILHAQNDVVKYSISGIIIKSYSTCSIHKSSVYKVTDGYVNISKGNVYITINDEKYSMLMSLSGNSEYLNGIVTEQSKSRIVCEGMIKTNPKSELDRASMKAYLGYNDQNGNGNAFSNTGCLAGQSFKLTVDIGTQSAIVKFAKNNSLIEEINFKLDGVMWR